MKRKSLIDRKVAKKISEIDKLSDEEILEKEKKLYVYSGLGVIFGLLLLIACGVVFSVILPYL